MPPEEAWLLSAHGHLHVAQQEFKQLRSDALIRHLPDSAKEMRVLRDAQRTVAGRQGEESAWVTHFNNGAVQYKFMWTRLLGEPSLISNPALTLQFTAGDPMNPNARLPDETALVALWDAVLDSAQKR